MNTRAFDACVNNGLLPFIHAYAIWKWVIKSSCKIWWDFSTKITSVFQRIQLQLMLAIVIVQYNTNKYASLYIVVV